MEERQEPVLRRVAVALGALSVLATIGTATTAGVVRALEHGATADAHLAATEPALPVPTHDYTGWQRVTFTGTSYRVPPGWRVTEPEQEVSYRVGARTIVRGHALGTYGGNRCREDGEPVMGAWAVLAAPPPGDARTGDASSVEARVQRLIRRWSRGYVAGEGPTPMSAIRVRQVRLADGSQAVRGVRRIDMSALTGRCAPPRGEVMVTVPSNGRSVLVQARYLDVPGALPDRRWRALADSLDPG